MRHSLCATRLTHVRPSARAQLADFLALHLDKAQGVMTLPDVYCLFNRARGSELVSPEDLMKARSDVAAHARGPDAMEMDHTRTPD